MSNSINTVSSMIERVHLLWWLLVDAAESGDGSTTVDNVSLPKRYCGGGGKALRAPVADTRGGGGDRAYREMSALDAMTDEGGVTGADHFDGGREGAMEALNGSGTDTPSPGSLDEVEQAESIEWRRRAGELPPWRRNSCA